MGGVLTLFVVHSNSKIHLNLTVIPSVLSRHWDCGLKRGIYKKGIRSAALLFCTNSNGLFLILGVAGGACCECCVWCLARDVVLVLVPCSLFLLLALPSVYVLAPSVLACLLRRYDVFHAPTLYSIGLGSTWRKGTYIPGILYYIIPGMVLYSRCVALLLLL